MPPCDLSPPFRAPVGADRPGRLPDSAKQLDQSAPAYPPYNIEAAGEDEYRIVIAIAGFTEADLEITAEDSTLTVRGRVKEPEEGVRYLYRGIAGRAFERRFQLAEFIEVRGAKLENGLLTVDLAREVPEALKPRNIQIDSAATKSKPTIIEGANAA